MTAIDLPHSTVTPAESATGRIRHIASRIAIYGILILWAFVCLFPIFWTVTTSFKIAPDVMKGNLIPFVDFWPQWKGWQSLGLSPDTIFQTSTVRDEFLKRFWNSVVASIVASFLEPILTTRHPTGTARVGETWTYRDKLEESPLGTFTIVTEYRLESVEAETAVIALSGSITAGPAPGGGEAPFDLLGSANSGRMVWNTAEGILDSLEQTQRVDLRTSMQGVKMDLVNSTTVKLTRMRQ